MNDQKLMRRFSLTLFDGAASGGEGASASGGTQGAPADTGAGNRANTNAAPAAGGQNVVMSEDKARREEFERLISTDFKDLYTEKTQRLINGRYAKAKEMEEAVKKTAPLLERLAERYGESDPDKLLAAMDDDDAYYQAEALEKGMTVDQLKTWKRMERENAAFKKEAEEQERQGKARELYADWMRQGKDMREHYPNFDIEEECQNEEFLSLLKNGVPVKTAYEVLHMDEIMSGAMAYTAERVREKTVNDIRARGQRPAENGLSGGAAAVHKVDVNNMTKAEREAMEKRALRGERIEF